MTWTAVDLEKFSLADFSLHAASNPLGLGAVPLFPCRARSDVKSRAGTRTRASKTPFQRYIPTTGGPRGLKTAPGTSLDGSHSVPRGLQTAPRAFQEAPQGFPEAFRRPQERTKRPPDASKSTSRGSQTLPEVSRPLREHPSRLDQPSKTRQERTR